MFPAVQLNEKEEEMEGQMKEEDHRITELSEKNQEVCTM